MCLVGGVTGGLVVVCHGAPAGGFCLTVRVVPVCFCSDLYACPCCTLLKFWVRSIGFAWLLGGGFPAECKSVIV